MSLRRSARVGALAEAGRIASTAAREEKASSAQTSTRKSKGASTRPTLQSNRAENGEQIPPRKRRRTKGSDGKPALRSQPTVTPSAVRLMATPYSLGQDKHATRPLMDRAAEPHATNAPLVSPETSRRVAYSDEAKNVSPTEEDAPKPTTTTGKLLEEACAHLIKVDPKLKLLIDRHPCRLFSPEGLAEDIDPFRSLASGIIAQQVGGWELPVTETLDIERKTNEHRSPERLPNPSRINSWPSSLNPQRTETILLTTTMTRVIPGPRPLSRRRHRWHRLIWLS